MRRESQILNGRVVLKRLAVARMVLWEVELEVYIIGRQSFVLESAIQLYMQFLREKQLL